MQIGFSFARSAVIYSCVNSRFLRRRILAYSVFFGSSSASHSGSVSRSPFRLPTIVIPMSLCGSSPLNLIICSASSMIFMRSPMSSKYDSPFLPTPPVCRTSEQASGMVIKYRSMSGEVTVTGPPFFICSIKRGRIEPRDPKTLPNLTNIKFAESDAVRAASRTSFSDKSLLTPYTLTGSTALSVEISTKRFTPCRAAASSRFCVPNTLFATAATGFSSIMGTCLYAAQWKITSQRVRPII